MKGGWTPLFGLLYSIVNSVEQGKFAFVREKLDYSVQAVEFLWFFSYQQWEQ